MPGTPVSPPLPPMMAMANARTYAVEVKEPDSGFGIIYFELPEDEWEKLPMEQRFALIRQGIAAKSPATAVVADKKITLNGNSGREHVLKDPEKGTLVVRFYAIRPRIFILFAGGKNFQPNSPEIEKFFSSFRLLKK
jgi:hypothetical protein